MLVALCFLSVAGAGAWVLSKWSLDALVALCIALGVIWPLAYFAYGALAILAIPSLGFAVVVGLKSAKATGPGGASFEITGDDDSAPSVTTTTQTIVKASETPA